MTQLVGIIVGAVVALGGGALTTLFAPWIVRRWSKADRVDQLAKDHEAALREAVEGFLAEMWSADIEMSLNAVRNDDPIETEEGRAQLLTLQRMQRAEVHLALLLTREQEPIHNLVLAYTEAVLDRPNRGDANEVGLRPIRQEVTTRLARWLSQDETPQQARDAFDAWLNVNWPEAKLLGEMGGGRPAL